MGLIKKSSKWHSIFALKCPKCHEADMFKTRTFSFKKPFDMKDECDHCRQDFMPEPGYYYGAMFVSYIFMGWFSIAFMAFFHWVLGWSLFGSFGFMLLVVVIFFVYIFRLGRSLWINMNYKYDPEASVK